MFIVLYSLILVELVFVAYFDMRFKTIKNYWSILNILVYISCLFLMPDLIKFSLSSLIMPLFFLFFGFLLFASNIMGAGDVKFLSTFFLLIPEIYMDSTVLGLIYATILIGGGLVLINTIKNYNAIVAATKSYDFAKIKSFYGTKFSFAPVITISWIYMGVVEKIWTR